MTPTPPPPTASDVEAADEERLEQLKSMEGQKKQKFDSLNDPEFIQKLLNLHDHYP